MRSALIATVVAALVAAAGTVPSATAYPHIYKNGMAVGEGKPFRMLGWGNVTYTNATVGSVECHTLYAEALENPPVTVEEVGGKKVVREHPARGWRQVWGPYECVSPLCASAAGSIEVQTSLGFAGNWTAELTEVQAGVIRDQWPLVSVSFSCPQAYSTASFAGSIAPRFVGDGTAIGSVPEEVAFDANSPTLTGADGALTLGGRIKVEGYGAEELTTVRNP
jgi:hypothetical protein